MPADGVGLWLGAELGQPGAGSQRPLCLYQHLSALAPFKKSISLGTGGFVFTGNTALRRVGRETLVLWRGDELRENASIMQLVLEIL